MPNPRGWHEGTEPITSPPCISTGPIHYPGLTSLTFPYTHGPILVFLVHRLSALSPCLLFLTYLDVHLARLSSHFSWHLTAATSPTLVCLTLIYLTCLWLVSLSHYFSLSRFVTSSIRFVRSAGILLPQSVSLHFTSLHSRCFRLATLDQRAIQPGQLGVFRFLGRWALLRVIVVAPLLELASHCHNLFELASHCRNLFISHFSWHLTATTLILAGEVHAQLCSLLPPTSSPCRLSFILCPRLLELPSFHFSTSSPSRLSLLLSIYHTPLFHPSTRHGPLDRLHLRMVLAWSSGPQHVHSPITQHGPLDRHPPIYHTPLFHLSTWHGPLDRLHRALSPTLMMAWSFGPLLEFPQGMVLRTAYIAHSHINLTLPPTSLAVTCILTLPTSHFFSPPPHR